MPFSAAAQATQDQVSGRTPAPTTFDGSTVAQRSAVNLAVADLGAGVVGGLVLLPAGTVPVAMEIDAAQLDSNGAPALAYSIGILNAGQTAISTSAADGGAAWATGQTTGRTAGGSHSGFIPSRPMKTVTPAPVDRWVGIQVTGAAATAVAGQMAMTLHYRFP